MLEGVPPIKAQNWSKEQNGDRFIPQRMANNMYETRFLNEENACLNVGMQSQGVLNPETNETINNQANN